MDDALRRIVAGISSLHPDEMKDALSLRDWRWPVLAMAASFAMLGGAHAFEIFGKMAPCPLCLRQREIYWAAIAMAVTGLVLWRLRPGRRFLVALNVLLGMVFVTGTVIAIYHAGVEWKLWEGPAGCSAGVGSLDLSNIDLSDALNKPMATGNCGEAPWVMLGLSMAGWNAVISAGLALISFAAAKITHAQGRAI